MAKPRDDFYDATEGLAEAFEELQKKNEAAANQFWESLSYEDKCNAFHAVVSRIVEGDIVRRGSYRYVLYDIFGFDTGMYIRGMDCGYMTLHNHILNDDPPENHRGNE